MLPSVCAASCGLPGLVVGPYKLNAGSGQLLHAIAHGIGRRFTPEPHKLPIQVSFEQFYELTSRSHLLLLLLPQPLTPCTVVGVSTSCSIVELPSLPPVRHVVAKCCACQLLKRCRNRFHHRLQPAPSPSLSFSFPTHTMRRLRAQHYEFWTETDRQIEQEELATPTPFATLLPFHLLSFHCPPASTRYPRNKVGQKLRNKVCYCCCFFYCYCCFFLLGCCQVLWC